jgi:hypothetical protein
MTKHARNGRAKSQPARRSHPESAARRRAHEQLERRVVKALLLAREGRSLTRAAKLAGTTLRTMRQHARSSIRKDARGHYIVRPRDTLRRPMRFLTPDGQVTLPVRQSGTASEIAHHMAAVKRYFATGDTTALRRFRGRAIRVGKLAYAFITDPRTLERLWHAGEVQFEDLYVHTI